MNTQELIARQKQNQATLLTSALLAKAVIRMSDGSLRILAVYNKSTRCEFYWSHQTKSKSNRAGRKSWIKPRSFARDFNMGIAPYSDFRSFAEWYAANTHAALLSVCVYKARRLAQVLVSTDHEALSHDWNFTPAMNSHDPRDFKCQNRRLALAFGGAN